MSSQHTHKHMDMHTHHLINCRVHWGHLCVLLQPVQDKQRSPGPYSLDVTQQDSSLVILTSTSLVFMAVLLYLWCGALLMLVPQSAARCTQWLQLLLFVPKMQPEASFHHQFCVFLLIFGSSAVLPNQRVFRDPSPKNSASSSTSQPTVGKSLMVCSLTYLRHINIYTGSHIHILVLKTSQFI